MKKINLSRKEKKIVYSIATVFAVLILWYGYNCFSQKVCNVEFMDRLVRHDLTIVAPHGAIVAEVADTKASRELGLSGRNGLRNNEGMLFVFESLGRYGFWMKDMNFPIDMLWINQNGIVVKSESNLSPSSYPNTFINDAPAMYVLELGAGRAEEYGIFLGSKLKIEE